MKKINLKKTLLLTAFAVCSTSATAPALSGGLQSELNELFGNMSNYTQPGVYESTRRGVLAGGGAQIRSRRMNIQLIAFEPPNIKAGCGGIDIFLGSFSYINLGSSDFLVKQGARWYPGRGQNWLVRRMQRSSLLNYRNRCQNLVGARRKHTRPHPHQAEPDQVPALQSAAYAAE